MVSLQPDFPAWPAIGEVPCEGPALPVPSLAWLMNHPLSLSFSVFPLQRLGRQNQRGPLVTQAFPIALFEHPLLLARSVFHVLFGTDRKPSHCFATWILALMKEALHQIIGFCHEPLSRAGRPDAMALHSQGPQGALPTPPLPSGEASASAAENYGRGQVPCCI